MLARPWFRTPSCRLSSKLKTLAIFVATALLFCSSAQAAKNVIVMISDGGGQNQWLAASMYQGRVGKQIYDQPGWLRLSCCTFPLNAAGKPTGKMEQDPKIVYDPAKAWDTTAAVKNQFAGYLFLTTNCTDSAAAATVLASGQKTYNHAINWTNDDRPMTGQTIAEIAKEHGKSTGVVTSVPWSDATPAGLGGAHNIDRGKHTEIANEMLRGDVLDVIMGCGNPDYDNNGRPKAEGKKRDYGWVGGEKTWRELKAGQRPWKLIESKADFEALVNAESTPAKVLGVPTVGITLQKARNETEGKIKFALEHAVKSAIEKQPEPFSTPFNQNVPTLATMALGAIHCFEKNSNGFYLMIEGGAVDWANHSNTPERMVEEQIDFVKTVEAVVAWIERHGGWDENVLIMTADHESGLLWGANSKTVAFDPVKDNGAGRLPGLHYNSHGHSHSLVPLYARGGDTKTFRDFIVGRDEKAGKVWDYSGEYVDDSTVFKIMRQEMTGEKAEKK